MPMLLVKDQYFRATPCTSLLPSGASNQDTPPYAGLFRAGSDRFRQKYCRLIFLVLVFVFIYALHPYVCRHRANLEINDECLLNQAVGSK